MHRATPSDSSHRGYSAGGRVGVVKNVTDKNGLQTAESGMMKNESRNDVEAPQNYGFTSVTADGDANGGPEAMVSYMGGNGSFPVISNMDDRRHRLKSLDTDEVKGSVAMYGLKEWKQQLLNTKDGWFMTGPVDKKIRLALIQDDQQQQGGQQGGGQSGGGGSGGGGDGGQSDEDMGQKSLRKKESKKYVDVHKDGIHHVHDKEHRIMMDDKETAVHVVGKDVYVGKVKEKAGHQKLAHRTSIDSRGHGIVAKVSQNTWTPQGS